MFRLKYFLVLASTLYVTQALSQAKSLCINVGPGMLSRQDLTFSPFVHTDLSVLNVGVQYDRVGRVHHWAYLQGSTYTPSIVDPYVFDTDETSFPHSFLLVNLGYGIGKRVSAAEAKSPLTLGICIDVDVQPSTYQYNPFSSFGYYASVSAGIWGRKQISLDEKNKLELGLQLPVVALIARSPYLVNDDEFIENTYSHNGLKTFIAYLEDGHIRTWDKMQQGQFHLNLKHALSAKWSIGLAYDFSGLHVTEPTNLVQFQHILSLQTNINL